MKLFGYNWSGISLVSFTFGNLWKKFFLYRQKRLFFATPRHQRVVVKLDRDGRHLTFLLVSLAELRMAVQVISSGPVFREVMALSASSNFPFVYVSKESELYADILITDDPNFAREAGVKKTILMDHDFFDENRKGLRMPYFMPPSLYHGGWHRRLEPSIPQRRNVRLGFFGSHNAKFYTRHFHFPMLSRTPILDRFLKVFDEQIHAVSGTPALWERSEIAVSLDHSGGDRVRKAYLSRSDYLAGLTHCDFLLCPPGWCMPLSHNMVEGMACGAIPLLNYANWLTPPLQDGVDCLTFESLDDLERQVRMILTMPQAEIIRMRKAVVDYYRKVFAPGVWLKEILERDEPETIILANNEEVSMGLRYPFFSAEVASFPA